MQRLWRLTIGLFALLRRLPYFPQVVRLVWRLWRDPRVPLLLKGMLLAVAFYVLSPLDLLPDFLFPVLGELDDLTLLCLAIHAFLRWCPKTVLAEHLADMDTQFQAQFRQWYAF